MSGDFPDILIVYSGCTVFFGLLTIS